MKEQDDFGIITCALPLEHGARTCPEIAVCSMYLKEAPAFTVPRNRCERHRAVMQRLHAALYPLSELITEPIIHAEVTDAQPEAFSADDRGTTGHAE